MALRLPRSKGLVILIACGAGLAISAAMAVIPNILKYTRLSSEAAMLSAAPETFKQGRSTNLFEGFANIDTDITAFHPAYLLGAVSAVLTPGTGCNDAAHISVQMWGAYCRLARGVVAVESNMMPQLVFAVAENHFDPAGTPLDRDGQPLQRPEILNSMARTSFATIRYSEATSDQPRISNLITYGLANVLLSNVPRQGIWTTARHGLGFKTCFTSKDSTGISVSCYRG